MYILTRPFVFVSALALLLTLAPVRAMGQVGPPPPELPTGAAPLFSDGTVPAGFSCTAGVRCCCLSAVGIRGIATASVHATPKAARAFRLFR